MAIPAKKMSVNNFEFNVKKTNINLTGKFFEIASRMKSLQYFLLMLGFSLINILAWSQDPIKEVKIGSQVWMGENLSVIQFRNGDPISFNDWFADGYRGIPSAKKYGYSSHYYYNYFAVNDKRGVCPLGWRVPSDYDWDVLESYLGSDGGYMLKSKSNIEYQTSKYTVAGHYEKKWVPCSSCDWMTDKQFENNGCSKCRNNRGKYVQGKYIPE